MVVECPADHAKTFQLKYINNNDLDKKVHCCLSILCT